MTIMSMTGFARDSGTLGPWRWTWELKTVNARGLDVRVRVPPAFDMVEAPARKRIGEALARGTCYANLSAQRESVETQVRVNEQALEALRDIIKRTPLDGGLQPASLDGLLSVRGIVEVLEASDDEETVNATVQAMLASLERAVDELVSMRSGEGTALHAVLETRLSNIAALTEQADACPGRQPEAVRARLARTIEQLAGTSSALDPVRLHQEALLMAGKADVREELDRLRAHVDAARDLMSKAGAVGRRLDFLSQELGREANTLCSKSNDAELTSIGMELRVEIEQFREQVQNIE